MSGKKSVPISDASREDGQPLTHVENEDLMPLPAPLNDPATSSGFQAAFRADCRKV